MTPRTVLFVGVGGQGALSAAGFLGEAAFRKGLAVTVSQLHGMSQRGGSVQAAVTIGSERVLSPASMPVDVLVGLELIEAARLAVRLTASSIVLCNHHLVQPVQAALLGQSVPSVQALEAELHRRCASVKMVDALQLAEEAGHSGALNAVMLGALSCLPQCPVTGLELLEAIQERGSPRALRFNQRAFALGQEAMSAQC